MDGSDVFSWLEANVPQTILLIGGLIAIVLAAMYLKDKESGKYKAMMALGVVFGAVMLAEAVINYSGWQPITITLVAVAGFTLVIRPFREVHFAVLLALLVMALVYIWLGGLTTLGSIDISFLAENPVRIIIAFIVGGLSYAVFHFAEALVKLFGKIFNLWPLLFVLGCVCVIESVLMFTGNGSILQFVGVA